MGGGSVAFLVALLIVVAVVVLMMRAATAPGGAGGRIDGRPSGGPRPPRPRTALGPDDDPDFLRELSRRTRRDDGSPA